MGLRDEYQLVEWMRTYDAIPRHPANVYQSTAGLLLRKYSKQFEPFVCLQWMPVTIHKSAVT